MAIKSDKKLDNYIKSDKALIAQALKQSKQLSLGEQYNDLIENIQPSPVNETVSSDRKSVV